MKNTTISDKNKQEIAARAKFKNKKLFKNADQPEVVIITSSSDEGVIRNGGRQGSYLGPKVILNEFGKLQSHSHSKKSILCCEVTSTSTKLEFEEAQSSQALAIEKALTEINQTTLIHIGGGHDHIYPFITGLKNSLKERLKLNIINIDAHLDTRIDKVHHSGTPFRQLDEQSDSQFTLHQVGIQRESNQVDNYKELKTGKMTVHQWDNHFDFKKLINNESGWINILSIDVDALSSNDFKSCSAVNPSGIPDNVMNRYINEYVSLIEHSPIVGFYEYNPIYDDISNSDAKKIAWKINQIMK